MISTPFGITEATNLVELDGQNRGRGTFTVTNRSGQMIRGRSSVVPTQKDVAGWLNIEGEAERRFAIDTTQRYSVGIAVAKGTPTGDNGG